MKFINSTSLLVVTILATFGASTPIAHSAPMGEGVGVCYAFKDDKLKSQKPCIISHGYGAGSSYTTLTIGKKSYNFEYAYEDELKVGYYRNLFYYRITLDELSDDEIDQDKYLSCFYHKPYDMCYKF